MFTVNCPGHRARVLLGPRSIERLVDTADGLAIEWRCHCGSRGVVGRDGSTPATHLEQAACA